MRVIAGLLSVLLTVWLPYEAVFDERRLMMWDRVDAVAGAVVRRQLDWPWYMLEAVVFVGVLWLLNADKSGFPFWVGGVFRYGIVVWCVFVVAGSLFGWRMVRVRQRMWPTWRYWYRNGVIASFVVACVCIAMMCWAFFRGFGVPVLVEIRYEPAAGVSSVTYSVRARDWRAKRTVDAGSTVVLRGETDLSDNLYVGFVADDSLAGSGSCSISVDGRVVVSGDDNCQVRGAYYLPLRGLVVPAQGG